MWGVAFPTPFIAKVSCPDTHCLISCLLWHSLLSKNAVLFLQSVERSAAKILFSLQLAHTSTIHALFPTAPFLKATHPGSSLNSQVPFYPSFNRHKLVPCSYWPTMQPSFLSCCVFRCQCAFGCVTLQAWQEIPVNKCLRCLSFRYVLLREHTP